MPEMLSNVCDLFPVQRAAFTALRVTMPGEGMAIDCQLAEGFVFSVTGGGRVYASAAGDSGAAVTRWLMGCPSGAVAGPFMARCGFIGPIRGLFACLYVS